MIAPFERWPLDKKQLFLKAHKNHNERFRMFMFLWANGMPPRMALHFTLIHRGYDESAVRDMRELVKAATLKHGRTYQRMMAMPTFIMY